MSEVVDSIVAELIAKTAAYEAGFDRAIAKNDRFKKSVKELQALGGSPIPQQYSERLSKAVTDGANAHEKAADRIKRAAKSQSTEEVAAANNVKAAVKSKADAEKTAARESAAAVKTAAREKVAAEKAAATAIANAQRSAARETQAQQRAYYAQGPKVFEAKAREFSSADQLRDAQAVSAAAKLETDAVKAAKKAESAAAKEAAKAAQAAAREQVEAAKVVTLANERAAASAAALAAKQAQTEANSARRTIHMPGDNPGLRPATGGLIGATVPNEPTGQKTIPLAVLNGGAAAEVAAETEVNHLLADRFDLSAKAAVAEGAVKRELKDQIEYLRRIDTYKKAGLADDAAIIRAEGEIAAIEALRAKNAKAPAGGNNTGNFVRGASMGRLGGAGSAAGMAGLALAATAVGVGVAIDSSMKFAKELQSVSTQLGITTKDLQVYQVAAENVGVSNEQLRVGFSQLNQNLGKAQTGAVQQGKIFTALGIDIGNSKDGFKSLSDILPTIVERISSIKDPAKRAAVEMALFGESGARLDALLSGGIESINKLADGMEKAGSVLSDSDIAKLKTASDQFARLGRLLQIDITQAVAANTDKILALAGALMKVAENAGAAIQAYGNFTNLRLRNDTSAALPDRMRAQNDLLSTKTGRIALQNDLTAKLDANSRDRVSANMMGGSGRSNADLDREFKRLSQERDNVIKYDRAADKIDAAKAAGGNVQGGKVNQGLLNSLNAPKPPKGKSADQVEAERLERAKKFAADEARLQDERLGLLSDLTADTREQDELQRERVRRDRDAKDKEYKDEAEATILKQKLKGADAAEQRARAQTLIGLNDSNADLELRGINRREMARFNDEELASSKIAAGIETDKLNDQLALARTAKERREIETRLLAIAAEQERQALQKQVDDKTLDPRSRADARTQLNALPAKTARDQAAIDKRDQGPMAAYIDSLPKTANEVRESLEKAAVDGAARLSDNLATALAHMAGLNGEAGDFLATMIKIVLQMVQAKAYSAAQPGGGGFSGFINGLGSLFGGGNFTTATVNNDAALAGISGLPGFASGGSGVISGNPGIDRNTLSLNGNPIANVGSGELLSISPNVAASNASVRSAAPQITVIAPQHFDMTNAVMTSELVGQINANHKAYTDAVGRASYEAAVQTSGNRVGGIVTRQQTLGS